MKKKLLAILLLLIATLVFSLSSCDLTNKDKGSDTEIDTGNTPCQHTYGEWEIIETGNCLATGKHIRTCTLCGKQEITFPLGNHILGELIEEAKPTFFKDGNIAHYKCSVCNRIFDENKNELDSTTISKIEPKLSVCLDGEMVAELTVVSSTSNSISLSALELSVTLDQTLSICLTEKPDTVYEYTVLEKQLSSVGAIAGNIDPLTHKIRSTSVSNISLTMKNSGEMELYMDGYILNGIVIETISSRSSNKPAIFPMSKVDYYGNTEKQAYVFGIFGSDRTTSFIIKDMDTGKVYGYDDISEDISWDKWSYSRGDNGEIVFADVLTDWWIAFDIGGDEKITLKRFNLPNNITSELYVTGTIEEAAFEKIKLDPDSDEYKYYTWPLFNGVFSRTEVWLDSIDEEKLYVYKAVIDAEKFDTFYIPLDKTRLFYNHICELSVSDGAITKDTKNAIRVNKTGKYLIEYLPFCNIINISDYIEPTPEPEPIEGIVIEINGKREAMNFVTYPTDETSSYVYGYVNLITGDKLIIRDTESNTVWGYDDITEALGWDTWDYHRGENGEIVIDFSARYGIEFDNNGDKKINLAKAFAPYHGESFGLTFDNSDREEVIFDYLNLSDGDNLDSDFMWSLTHTTTMNNSDIVDYINENGLYFYYTVINLEEGEKFNLKNLTANGIIGADYMSDITGDIYSVTRDGDLVKVLKSGSFYIIYLPSFNSFTVEYVEQEISNDIYIYIGDGYKTLTPDENGDVKYDGFDASGSTTITVTDSMFTPLPIIIDESMDKTLVNLYVTEGYCVAYITKKGTFNLRYNVNTNNLYIEIVGEETVSVPKEIYFAFDNRLSLKENSENTDELCYLGLTVEAWDEFKIRDTDLNYIADMTLIEGTAGIVTDGRIITFQAGGTFDFYINKTTHQVRVTASTGGSTGGEYIDYSNGIYLYLDKDVITVYPDEDGNIKYNNISVTDDSSIMLVSKDYKYLPMTLDPSVSSSVAKVYSNGDTHMLLFYQIFTFFY